MSIQKKIVILSNSVWSVANFRSGLINHFIDEGYKVVVIAPHDEFVARLSPGIDSCEDISINSKGLNPFADFILIFKYVRRLLQVRPDLIISFTIKPNIYGSIASRFVGFPFISNVSGLGTVFLKGGLLEILVKWLYRISVKRCSWTFFQNPEDMHLFINNSLVKAEKSSLLPGSGVDLNYFRRANDTERTKHRSDFVFLYVGRLIQDKGILDFFSSAVIVKTIRPKCRFQIVGFIDSNNRTAISRRVLDNWVESGVVEYLGAAKDVRPYYLDSDCVVLPSYREGLPRSLLEACAMRVPIIASDVPGCREVVLDGVNGFFCRARDPNDLAEKMLAMVDLPSSVRTSMGLAGRKFIEDEFDEGHVIRRYDDMILRFCA